CAPRVLLLDEPAAGVPTAERQDILDAIAALPADVSVLLIEHDMDVVFGFAQRISVLVAVVLSDIGLRLGEGEALAVLGRNGVGKTTLIDSIVGVTRRFAGSLSLGGR